jgi:hypothetical protein
VSLLLGMAAGVWLAYACARPTRPYAMDECQWLVYTSCVSARVRLLVLCIVVTGAALLAVAIAAPPRASTWQMDAPCTEHGALAGVC